VLSGHFPSIEALSKAGSEELMSIPSIGPKVSDGILAFFRQPQNIRVLEKLSKAGVQMSTVGPLRKDLPLSGKEFVITGKLEKFGRQQAETLVRELGGKASSDVTKKTTYVVVGVDPGSKLARAQALGIEILNEDQFNEILIEAKMKSGNPEQIPL